MGRKENRFARRLNGGQPPHREGFMSPEELQGVMEEIAERRGQHAQFFVTVAQKMFTDAVVHSNFDNFEEVANLCIEATKALAAKLQPFAEELAKDAPIPAQLRMIENQVKQQRAEAEKNDPLEGKDVRTI